MATPAVAMPSESELQDGQIITKSFEFTNGEGQRVKVTRKIKIHKDEVKVPKEVQRRRNLTKFGKVKGFPKGPEGITVVDENIELVLGYEQKKPETKQVNALESLGKGFKVVCRNCGENHLTFKCPYPPGQVTRPQGAEEEAGPAKDAKVETKPGAPGKYVPMHLREGAQAAGRGPASMDGRGETVAIRVTNVSTDARQSDLEELFSPFGYVQRVFIPRDNATQMGRGFAFVHFSRRDDAERAMKALEGHRYDHLVLHLEWARPN